MTDEELMKLMPIVTAGHGRLSKGRRTVTFNLSRLQEMADWCGRKEAMKQLNDLLVNRSYTPDGITARTVAASELQQRIRELSEPDAVTLENQSRRERVERIRKQVSQGFYKVEGGSHFSIDGISFNSLEQLFDDAILEEPEGGG